MTANRHPPNEHMYALRLQPDPTAASVLCGRLEHVISGRCQMFGSGEELLAGLRRDLALKASQVVPPAAA